MLKSCRPVLSIRRETVPAIRKSRAREAFLEQSGSGYLRARFRRKCIALEKWRCHLDRDPQIILRAIRKPEHLGIAADRCRRNSIVCRDHLLDRLMPSWFGTLSVARRPSRRKSYRCEPAPRGSRRCGRRQSFVGPTPFRGLPPSPAHKAGRPSRGTCSACWPCPAPYRSAAPRSRVPPG